MRFDLTDLRLFLAVADRGSITHGAADAGLSLPAASERLRQMELSGGIRLLERGRRGVTLTEAGEALAHHARMIQRQTALMQGELADHATAMRSTLRMLANTAAIAEFLPQRLASWMAAHPRVDLDLKERQSTDIARAVLAGFADIGILSRAAAPESVVSERLILRPFARDQLVVIAPPDHDFAGARQLCLAELSGQYFIGLSDSALQDHIAAQAAAIGMALRYRLRLRSFDALCQMVGAGVGIAVIPRTAAVRSRRGTGIAMIPLGDDWASRELSVCRRSDASLPALALSLFDHMSQGTAVE